MNNDASKNECPDAQLLGHYIAGQLGEPDLGNCEAHLAECEQCEQTVRELFKSDTAGDSFAELALESLKDHGDQKAEAQSEAQIADVPLVSQLIRDLSSRTPAPDQAARALESRTVEVTRLLPPSDIEGSIGRVGGYEVRRLLGAGSTGIVYEAEDAKLQRTVALKILRPSLGDAARERFMNEARAAAAISHPNVVTIYQVGVEGPLAFIAMELSDGQTLESRLGEVAFVPEEKVKQIALQVAEGLVAAHRHGLIHRDIKPANIWLKSDNDQAVILDFGLARIADDDPQMTATGMLAGTPNFMSPEQTRGLELDGRSDLFSLGCLMYRAATGKLPFGSTGILATLQAIQHESPRPPLLLNPHLTEDFSDLVMSLLEKQPVNRPANANDLAQALQHPRSDWTFTANTYGNNQTESARNVAAKSKLKTKSGGGFRRWVTAAILLLSTGAIGWYFSPQIIRVVNDQGELVIDSKDKDVLVEVLQGGELVRVIDTKTNQSVDIQAGEYRVQLRNPENGIRLGSDRVVLTRGSQAIVSIVKSEVPNLPAVANNGFRNPPGASYTFSENVTQSRQANNRANDDRQTYYDLTQGQYQQRQDRYQEQPQSFQDDVPPLASAPPQFQTRQSQSSNQTWADSRSSDPRDDQYVARPDAQPSGQTSNPAVQQFAIDRRTDSLSMPQLPQSNPPSNQLRDLQVRGYAFPDDQRREEATMPRTELTPSLPSSPPQATQSPPNQSWRAFTARSLSDQQRVQLVNNLKIVTLSLLNYEAAYRHFPTVGNRDANGQLLLSWRVQALPFLDQVELYQKFHLDEPWNSPHNLELLPLMPAVYRDPATPTETGVSKTRIQMPCGNGFLLDPERWSSNRDKSGAEMEEMMGMGGMMMGMDEEADSSPSEEAISFSDCIDGSTNTLAVIQVNEANAVHWTRPVDWDGDPRKVAPEDSKEKRQIQFFMADGSSQSLATPIDTTFLKALLTRAGGEQISFANQTVVFPPKINSRAAARNGRRKTGVATPARSDENSAMDEMDMDMDMGMGMGMGMMGSGPAKPQYQYAGQTFDQWIHVVKNDRQLKTKFEALAAVAELAQGNQQRKKLVLAELSPLLRKYGSKTIDSDNPFSTENSGKTVRNTFRNSELTNLFIEILKRFPADDLMNFTIEEIEHGTANSREFLSWLWLPSSMREDDPVAQMEYFRAIASHAVEIATSVLEAVKTCDDQSREALFGTIDNIGSTLDLELKPDQDPLEQYYNFELERKSFDQLPDEWQQLINKAFESDQPLQQGFVAVTLARTAPDRPNLAQDLAKLLESKDVLPELRAAAIFGLEELPLEKIQPVASTLLSVGQQSGPEKDRLIAWTKEHASFPRDRSRFSGINGSYPIAIDYRIGLLLSHLEIPPSDLLPWLKQLKSKAQADLGQARWGGPDQEVENTKIVVAKSIKAVNDLKTVVSTPDPKGEEQSPIGETR